MEERESDGNYRWESKQQKAKANKTSTGKRKFHQKSRNGCLTCKRRRVKCDETKPICQKCQHMNLVCGYTLENSAAGDGEYDGANKRMKVEEDRSMGHNLASDVLSVTPDVTPSPKAVQGQLQGSKIADLLSAGNLNNINVSHLVHSLSGLGNNLSTLGGLTSLTNLAALAQLPLDLSSVTSLMDPQRDEAMMQAADISRYAAQHNTKSSFHKSDPLDAKSGKESYDSTQHNGSGSNGHANHIHEMKDGEQSRSTGPNVSPNAGVLTKNAPINHPLAGMNNVSNLNMLDLRLMFHYTSQVAHTITGAGISDTSIWNHDVPMLAFNYPFLMHAMLAFSATHLSRTEKGLDQCVTCHRGEALRLLREAVLNINSDNTDALVASALILIMDSLANASFPLSTSPKSLPASAWIFHVKGAATILTAVWPLTEYSRFFKFISVDLGDLGDIINQKIDFTSTAASSNKHYTDLECHDSDLADLYPVEIDSPYLVTLAYLNKLHKERYNSDFILRVFAFPALLDKPFLSLLMSGDITAMRIMRSYYKLLRSFTTEMKDKVWFLEGVAQVLPVDVEEYAGGAGGMHMMLDFLGGGPSIVDNELDDEITKFDPTGSLANHLINTDNLPSDITSDLEVMQGDNGIMNIK